MAGKTPVQGTVGRTHVQRSSRVSVPAPIDDELRGRRTAPPRIHSRRLLEQVRRLQRERAAQR
jgi:hypothetical protein